MKLSTSMIKEINKHIDRKSNRLLRKGFFLGVFVMVGFTLINTYAFTVETNFTNAVQYIKSIFVTSNGKKTGSLLVAMNTGGKALVVNGSTQLLGDVTISGTLNADLNELDPVWTEASSGYYTKTQADGLFLTGETDSKWMTVSGSYYTKTQIDAKGYLTGESDPQVGTITTAGNRCKTDGSKINCTEPTPTFSETDPQVGTTDNGLRCRGDGSAVQCDQTAPLGVSFREDIGMGNIYYDAGGVFIGTGGNSQTLYINGGTNIGQLGSHWARIGYDSFGGELGIIGNNDENIATYCPSNNVYGYGGLPCYGVLNISGTKVGIGTTDPSSTLDVSGSIKLGTDGNIFSSLKILTGNLSSTGDIFIGLPTGRTYDNTIILNGMIKSSFYRFAFSDMAMKAWEAGYFFTRFIDGTSSKIIISSDYALIYNAQYKIVIMKQ